MSKPTKAELDDSIIEPISSHSMRVGAAQDLLNLETIMPIIMRRANGQKLIS